MAESEQGTGKPEVPEEKASCEKTDPADNGGELLASKEVSKDKPAGWRSRFGGALSFGIAGILIGIGGLTVFDRIVSTFSSSQSMRIQERQIAAVLQNRDMYTGFHQRKEGLNGDGAEMLLSDAQRETLDLTDDAIQHCHASLQVDIAARRAWGLLDTSEFASRSLEPQLRDLNFYLPCLMRVNKKRFCDPVQKHDMVLRIKAYVGLLDDAREARKKGPLNPTISRPASMIHKVAATSAAPLPMSYTPSADFSDALQDLSVLGLVSKSDFRKPWWSAMPEVIAVILDGHKAEEDACKS